MIAFLAGQEHHAEHAPPDSIFTPLWRHVRETPLGHAMGFDTERNHLGQYWFEAIGFSLIAAAVLVLCAFLATRRYSRVPRGLQNILEALVGFIRSLVHGFTGPVGDKYVPYLGTVFLFVFTMNLLGVLPAFRSPTMTLSTTLAIGLTTFVMVQTYAIRDSGLGNYLKHFAGDVVFLMPLMFLIEVIGECIKPVSLSLRLYGNIFGEDNVIEQLMQLGEAHYIPVQMPMLALAIFTSFLQAFIFTTLATIYIASKVVHEGGHGEEHGEHSDDHGHSHDEPKEKHAH